MSKLIASYRTSTTGYDAANTRFVDESGLGNHLPLLAGVPDFSVSYGGKPSWSMKGDAYFGGANLLFPELFTVIMAVHPQLSAGESIKAIWSAARNYAVTDPGHATPTGVFGDTAVGSTGPYARFLSVEDTAIQVGSSYWNLRPAGYVSNAWNIVTYVWNGETSQVKGRIGTGATGTFAIDQNYQVQSIEEFRLGFRPTNITTTAGLHMGCLRADIHVGDYTLDDPTGYAARIAQLIADPSA